METASFFIIIQNPFINYFSAWKLLRDPEARKKYNAELYQKTVNLRHIIHDTVSSKDFSYDTQEGYHYFTCKCGGYYILPESEDCAEEFIICCDECSLVIKVLHSLNLSNDQNKS